MINLVITIQDKVSKLNVNVPHCFIEENMAADVLAKMGAVNHMSRVITYLTEIPTSVIGVYIDN